MKAQKIALLVLSLVLSLSWDAGAVNTTANVVNGHSDLTVAASFSTNPTYPTATYDVTFTNVAPYSPTAFTLNTSENWGTLDDLSALTTAAPITIDNTVASTTSTLTLSQGSNQTSGANSLDYMYVASGASLSIGTASTGTLVVELGTPGSPAPANGTAASGNIDNNGTLSITSALAFNGSASNKILTFTGSGNTTVSGGITTVSGQIAVNSTGTVTFSGGNDGAATTTVTAGTLNVNNEVTGKVVVNGGTFSESSTGSLHGGSGVGIAVHGGTVTLAASNSYSGGTTIDDGATLTLTGQIASSTNALVLGNTTYGGGGTLLFGTTLTGSARTSSAPSTTLNIGSSILADTSGTLTLAAITRNAGSTVDFDTLSATTTPITTTTANANFTGGQQTILGGYATDNQEATWAVSGSGGTAGNISGLATSGYTSSFTATKDVDAPTGTSAPGSMTINSLRLNNAGSYTVNLGGAMTVATGGILETTGVGSNAASINNSTLTSGNGQDLIVIQNNTAANLTIGSQITGGIGLTKSGAGNLVLSGANNYTGATAVTAGGLLLANGGSIPSTTIGVVGGATFGTVAGNASHMTIGSTSTALTLNLGTSVAGNQSNLQLNLYSGGVSDTISAGTLTLNALPNGAAGTILITLNDTTNDNLSGTYNLLTWTSPPTGTITTSEFTLAGSAVGEGSLSVSGDDLIFTPAAVPEPSIWTMFILGLGVLGFCYRRRGQLKAAAPASSIRVS